LGNYDILMGDSRVVIPVIVGLLVLGVIGFQQEAMGELIWNVESVGIGGNYVTSIDCPDTNTCYAISGYAILKTTDGGTTWTENLPGITTGYFNIPIVLGDIDCPSVNTCYAMEQFFNSVNYRVVKTTDGGKSWSLINSVGASYGRYYIECPDVDTCYMTDSYTIFKTTDGGISWYAQTAVDVLTRAFGDITCFDTTTCYTFNLKGQIFKTTDGGTSWNQQTSGISGSQGLDCPSVSTCYLVGQYGTIWKTVDGAMTWEVQTSNAPFSAVLQVVDCIDIDTCYVGGSYTTMLKTIDGGTTWSSQSSGGYHYSLSCTSLDTCYAGGLQTLVKTIDGGASWNSLVSEVVSPNNIECPSENTCYMNRDGTGIVYKTTDGGTSWFWC